MKRLLMAMSLVLLLTVSAFAGNIPTVGIATENPTPATAPGETPTVGGDIPSVGSSLSFSAVDVIQTLFGLLSV